MSEDAVGIEPDTDSCLARRPKRPRSMRWSAYVATWLLKMTAKFVKMTFRLKVKAYNKGTIPKEGPVFVAFNHPSYADPPILAATTSRNGAAIAAAELRKFPIIGPIIALLLSTRGDILINRGDVESRKAAQVKANVILEAGGLVAAAPEGGIKKARWRAGMFESAITYKAAIVLVKFIGTDDLMASTKTDRDARDGKVVNRKARVSIIYSDPIFYDEYKHMDSYELAAFCQAKNEAMTVPAEAA